MKTPKEFKVLLLYPNLSLMKIPSLAIALFTATCKRAGYTVELFDASHYCAEEKNSHDDRRVATLQYRKFDKNLVNWELKNDIKTDFIEKVRKYVPDIVIVSVVEDTFNQGIQILNYIKDFDIPNIIGGVFPTMSPEEAIAPECVKMVGVGEGENLIIELCERLRKNESFEDISGLWIKKSGGAIIRNMPKKLVDINALIPDYSLFAEDMFLRPWGGKFFKTVAIEGCRGCPYDCTFCNSPKHNYDAREMGYSSFVRYKNLRCLKNEIDFLVNSIDPEFFMFVDDTFLTRSVKEISQWCEMYSAYKIPFWINTRVESISSDKLKLLKEVGCWRLSFSLEQGNEEFRKKYIKKNFSNETFVTRGKIVIESGIPFSVDVIIGFPFETRELVFDTIEVIRNLKGYDSLSVNIFTPYRGTYLREVVLQNGWLDSSLLPGGISGSSMLSMPLPYLQREEIDGLYRTFILYAYYPKSMWKDIERAEKFNNEGNNMFKSLSEEYYKQKFGNETTTFYSNRYVNRLNKGTGCRAPENSSV